MTLSWCVYQQNITILFFLKITYSVYVYKYMRTAFSSQNTCNNLQEKNPERRLRDSPNHLTSRSDPQSFLWELWPLCHASVGCLPELVHAQLEHDWDYLRPPSQQAVGSEFLWWTRLSVDFLQPVKDIIKKSNVKYYQHDSLRGFKFIHEKSQTHAKGHPEWALSMRLMEIRIKKLFYFANGFLFFF